MTKRALITGITGQDGSYLAELLLEKGYQVHGLVRRSSTANTSRIEHLLHENSEGTGPGLTLEYGDLGDSGCMSRLVAKIEPHEIYNLAAQSHVHVSFDTAEYTADVTGIGALRIFEAVRQAGTDTRIYQASSSEMFGSTPPPQDEMSRFHPRSPYACAKVFAHAAAINYRESYDMFVCSGILFNHESPRRGENFVTRKITRAVARIKAGLQQELCLGNLDARRDWGYAPEYVDAMWRMLQQDAPEDFVIATGESWSVQDFVEAAFRHVDLDWRQYVTTDPRFHRPAEVQSLIGDASRAAEKLGWRPQVKVPELVGIMVDADLAATEPVHT